MVDSTASAQQRGVLPNPDPALNPANEHRHPHLHHDPSVEKGRTDDVVYASDTKITEHYAAGSTVNDHELHHRGLGDKKVVAKEGSPSIGDAEKGSLGAVRTSEEEEPKRGKFSIFYAKYRIFFHIFIWLFFTG